MNKNFLEELRHLNIERQKEWDPENKATLSFKGLEFAGEAGELASKIKKLARKTEFDFIGSDYDMTDIEEEVGDVLITLDLVCQKMGVDIEKVTKSKFNATSDKVGLKTKFEPDVIYINIDQVADKLSFDDNIKKHVEFVNSLKPHMAYSKGGTIGIIFAEPHLNYDNLLPIYIKHHGAKYTPDRFSIVNKKDISVPKQNRNYYLDLVLEPYNHELNENLYCVEWNSRKHYIYSDHGENAKQYIGYTQIPMRFIDDFLKEARYFITQPFLLA